MFNPKPKVLIAEDDEAFARQLSETLTGENYDVAIAHDGSEALRILQNYTIDLGFIDMAMPGVDGMKVLADAQKIAPEVPLIMITGYATIDRAVQATRLGAYDFIEKPVSLDRILLTTERALEKRRLQLKSRWMSEEILSRYKMVGTSNAMQQVYSMIDKIAPANSTVLIYGETGTGKELVAMAIHLQSKRSNGPYVRVNCAAIPDTLIESELFGHKQGAYTGATADKIGKFVKANNGTILLDEVGDLSPSAQAKILRVLQEHEVEPVGDNRVLKVDVRIIAATNKNLTSLISEGKYREDLFYRLNAVEIHLPALRDRKEDIPELANHFLTYFCQQNNRYIQGFKPQAIQLLMQPDWPGNVRQLRSTIERLVIFATGELITVADVTRVMQMQQFMQTPNLLSYQQANELFQREFLTQALTAHDWNITAAADSLQIDRTNLYKKMQRLGIRKTND